MIEKLSKYAHTFHKFWEWYAKEGILFDEFNVGYAIGELEMESPRELLSLLVEFCDSKDYCISITKRIGGTRSMPIWSCGVAGEIINGSTRTEATEQAVIKCFELMSNN
jgi:hypothetical protein